MSIQNLYEFLLREGNAVSLVEIMSSATNISEDNKLRSQFVWHLINDQNNFVSQCTDQSIPLVLIQFWDDSESIPLDVQMCIESWRPIEDQGFKHFLFSDITANDFIKNNYDSRYLNAFHRCRHPAMRSDYFSSNPDCPQTLYANIVSICLC